MDLDRAGGRDFGPRRQRSPSPLKGRKRGIPEDADRPACGEPAESAAAADQEDD